VEEGKKGRMEEWKGGGNRYGYFVKHHFNAHILLMLNAAFNLPSFHPSILPFFPSSILPLAIALILAGCFR
jgi:hypothetical protein